MVIFSQFNCQGWTLGVSKWVEVEEITPEKFTDAVLAQKVIHKTFSAAQITDNINTFFAQNNNS